MDVMESPIERPQQGQKQFYSGKKGWHSLKSQIVIALSSREIYCTAYGKGKEHDFHLFQASGVHFHPDTQSLEDKGYRGIAKFHANSQMQIQPYRGQSQRSPNPGFGSNRRCHTVPSMPQS